MFKHFIKDIAARKAMILFSDTPDTTMNISTTRITF